MVSQAVFRSVLFITILTPLLCLRYHSNCHALSDFTEKHAVTERLVHLMQLRDTHLTHFADLAVPYDSAKYISFLNKTHLNYKAAQDSLRDLAQVQPLSYAQYVKERTTLFAMETAADLPSELEKCSPQKLTPEELLSIKSKIQALQFAVGNMTNCATSPGLQQEIELLINRQKVYMASIVTESSFKCTVPPNGTLGQLSVISTSVYKDNLNNNLWELGSLTQEQFKNERFVQTTKFNLTDCPNDKPFVNRTIQVCVPCPPGEIFRLSDRKCYKCVYGFAYNKIKKGCVPINDTVNESPNCNEGYMFNKEEQECKLVNCSSQLPYFNRNTNLCEKCPANTLINATLHVCQCDSQSYLNKTASKCELRPVCNSTSRLNETKIVCQPLKYVNNPDKLAYMSSKTLLELQNAYKQAAKDPLAAECPSYKPYFSKSFNQCVACPAGYPYFDLDIEKCKNCGDLIYNPTTHRCDANGLTMPTDISRFAMNIQ